MEEFDTFQILQNGRVGLLRGQSFVKLCFNICCMVIRSRCISIINVNIKYNFRKWTCSMRVKSQFSNLVFLGQTDVDIIFVTLRIRCDSFPFEH